jgi:hypothetical protein
MTKTSDITVLAIYTWKHNPDRICFTVRSSDGQSEYHTCFEHGRGACTCDGNAKWHKECKHIKGLRQVAAEKLAARQSLETVIAAVAAYDSEMAKALTFIATAAANQAAGELAPYSRPILPVTEQDVHWLRLANAERLAENAAAEAARRTSAPLNGNRAFSLMR